MTERLLQDEMEGYECQRLSRWFASRLDCREVVRRVHTNKLTGVNKMKVIRTTEGYMVELDNGDYLCDMHDDNLWDTRAEAEAVIAWAHGVKPNPQHSTWVGLTDEEIKDLYFDKFSMGELEAFARAIEAKLKEKNHG